MLRDVLPVPRLLAVAGDDALRMEFVAGVHGQELVESGHAIQVLRTCGEVLRRIHAVNVTDTLPDGVVPDGVGQSSGPVVVHGGFGPNNLLLDP